jgi:hypothetical protein
MSIRSVAVLMSEGNKNLYNLLILCAEIDPNILLTLDTMNMRGAQVWAAFSGYCGQFFPHFKECVMKREKEMIDYVNLKVPFYQAVSQKS